MPNLSNPRKDLMDSKPKKHRNYHKVKNFVTNLDLSKNKLLENTKRSSITHMTTPTQMNTQSELDQASTKDQTYFNSRKGPGPTAFQSMRNYIDAKKTPNVHRDPFSETAAASNVMSH